MTEPVEAVRAPGMRVTWWGHATVAVETPSLRVLTDPVLAGRLGHLRRSGPAMVTARRPRTDLVLVSHLHLDHLHVPSLRLTACAGLLLVPRGAGRAVRGLARLQPTEVEPGELIQVGTTRIEVLRARHDGRRWPWSCHRVPALGFRVVSPGNAWWYPGDTGMPHDLASVGRVDLAVVPIGGWGPSLGEDHLSPHQAADAAAAVGARWALAVHYGTYWPIGLRRLHPTSHHRRFEQPPSDFLDALQRLHPETKGLTPTMGRTIEVPPPVA